MSDSDERETETRPASPGELRFIRWLVRYTLRERLERGPETKLEPDDSER